MGGTIDHEKHIGKSVCSKIDIEIVIRDGLPEHFRPSSCETTSSDVPMFD